jgi:chemotaxis protein MotB
MRGTHTLAALMCAAAVSITAGCGVKKSTHQAALNELASTQGELATVRQDRDQIQARLDQLEAELSSMAAEKAKLSAADRAKIARLVQDMQATEAELLELRAQRDRANERLAAFREINERFRALVDTGKLEIEFRNGQMTLKLPSGVLFASAQATLSRTGQAALQEILDVLSEFKDRRFMIAGHTDNVAIRSRRFKNNWDLSTARAVSVLEYMIAAGFDPNNLAAAGYGEFDPVAPNDTDEGRQLNRRIEIILVPDLSELPNLTLDDA